MKKISIIVLNFNGKNFLKDRLTSLRKQTYKDFEIILLDNTSTNGSVEFVEKYYLWTYLIKSDKNLSFAKGNNKAFKFTKGE